MLADLQPFKLNFYAIRVSQSSNMVSLQWVMMHKLCSSTIMWFSTFSTIFSFFLIKYPLVCCKTKISQEHFARIGCIKIIWFCLFYAQLGIIILFSCCLLFPLFLEKCIAAHKLLCKNLHIYMCNYETFNDILHILQSIFYAL